MKKNTVVIKLFTVTVLCFFLFYILLLLVQTMFFERFYLENKKSELQTNVGSLANEVAASFEDKSKLAELTGNFMNETNATLVILDNQFELQNLYSYRIQLSKGEKETTLLLSGEGMDIQDIPKNLEQGDYIVADGYYLDEARTIMTPVHFYREGPSTLEQGLERAEGNVTHSILPKNRAYNPYFQNNLIEEILMSWRNSNPDTEELKKRKMIQYEYTDQWSGVPYIIMIHAVDTGSDPHYMLAFTTLQPVDEAVDTMKSYYPYLALAGFFLLLIISGIYSRIISKPLIVLSQKAAQLAELDFSKKMQVRSKDEFGRLSMSLQTLSENLQSTLTQLEEANDQLHKDIDQKQQLIKLQKEFTANVSHELKTPLGIIKGFTEGLQDGIAEQKRERYLSNILNEVEKMDALIMDLLQLSKYEIDAVKLNKNFFKIEDLIERVLDGFVQHFEDKSLKPAVSNQVRGFVHADPKRIEQVLVNLLSNAIRHANYGSTIDIICRSVDQEIEIRIVNEGESIRDELIERIWEKFYRIENSRSRKTGGTGLGLAIVSQILKLHNSPFGVENTETGVAFYFRLKESRDPENEKFS